MLVASILVGSGAAISSDASAARPTLVATMAPQLQGQLNLNTATLEQLDLLPGVGPATAKKIVDYREKHPFRSIKQLQRIDGIGPKTYERLKPFVTVEGDTTLTVAPQA